MNLLITMCRCTIEVKTQFVDVVVPPALAGWVITDISTSPPPTVYQAVPIDPSNYGASPLPFTIGVREASGVRDAYIQPALIAMSCFYQTYANLSTNTSSNLPDIQTLFSATDTNTLTNITECPTQMPTQGKCNLDYG